LTGSLVPFDHRAMSEQRLGRDVFIALAAIGWADGKLDADEADAIVRTAVDEGLEIEEIEEIEAATKSKVELGVIDKSGMSKADRLFVYAVAAWMTRLDGKRDEAEAAALDRLGTILRVPDRPREQADEIALAIADMPEGDRPAMMDLPKLRKTIAERLEAARQKRLAAGEDE
jgi:uncharacterized membrane protein YebE (DUF533 family)